MQLNYTRLNINERVEIALLLNKQEFSIRKVAKKINRSPSTVSRELRRVCDDKYNYMQAQENVMKKRFRNRNKIDKYKGLIDYLINNHDPNVRSIYAVLTRFKKSSTGKSHQSKKSITRLIATF
jgi:IS30 family transposase